MRVKRINSVSLTSILSTFGHWKQAATRVHREFSVSRSLIPSSSWRRLQHAAFSSSQSTVYQPGRTRWHHADCSPSPQPRRHPRRLRSRTNPKPRLRHQSYPLPARPPRLTRAPPSQHLTLTRSHGSRVRLEALRLPWVFSCAPYGCWDMALLNKSRRGGRWRYTRCCVPDG
jgi:hypothetical protein